MTTDTKQDRVVTYNEERPSKKSEDPLITWSCKFMSQIKYVFFFLLPQDFWLLNVAWW